jgi:hypothetical protein
MIYGINRKILKISRHLTLYANYNEINDYYIAYLMHILIIVCNQHLHSHIKDSLSIVWCLNPL